MIIITIIVKFFNISRSRLVNDNNNNNTKSIGKQQRFFYSLESIKVYVVTKIGCGVTE